MIRNFNEMFFKTGLIDEEYDGTERIELLDKEQPDLEFGDLENDLLCVSKAFHILPGLRKIGGSR